MISGGAPKILVVGGGAAGLSFAAQLSRRGVAATVWEKRPPEDGDGYAVGLWKNGFDVLAKYGAAAEVKSAGKISAFSQLTDEKGRVIRHADLSPLNQKYGAAVVFMTRGGLLQKLRKIADGAVFRRAEFAKLTTVQDGVLASDSSGNTEKFDLAVAADGIHSSVRRAVFGGGGIKKHNAVFYYFLVSMAEWNLSLEGDVEMTGPGAFLGMYPLADGRCGVYAAVYRRPGLLRRPAAEVLAEFFGHFGGHAPAVLAACQNEKIFGDVVRESCPPKWSAPGCVLIGDAAHAMLPTTGQGLSLAMEDGFLLANIVADAPSSQWAARFAEFETMRRRRIAPIRRRAALTNFAANYTPAFLCPARNALIRFAARGNKTAALDGFFQQDAAGK